MRKVEEWRGASDDTALPASVYLRIYIAQKGRCAKCTRLLQGGNIEREHVKPISMGGENRESNIQLWCRSPCSSDKTKAEAAPRAKADRVMKKHIGAKKKPPSRLVSRWDKATGRFRTYYRDDVKGG